MKNNETESDGFDSLRAAGVSEARIEAMKAAAARMAENLSRQGFGKAPRGGWTEADRVPADFGENVAGLIEGYLEIH